MVVIRAADVQPMRRLGSGSPRFSNIWLGGNTLIMIGSVPSLDSSPGEALAVILEPTGGPRRPASRRRSFSAWQTHDGGNLNEVRVKSEKNHTKAVDRRYDIESRNAEFTACDDCSSFRNLSSRPGRKE